MFVVVVAAVVAVVVLLSNRTHFFDIYPTYPSAHMSSFEKAALRVHATVMEMSYSLGERVVEAASAAIEARGRFSIAVSGGSLIEVRTGLRVFCLFFAAKHVQIRSIVFCNVLFCFVLTSL